MKLIIFFSYLHLFLNLQVHAQDLVLLETCSTSENYTSNSQFQTNLNLLLRSLWSNGSRDGFYNTSIGAGADTVYGLVQCGGDVSSEDCRTCLNRTSVEITQRCPRGKQAALRYNPCLLRYSNSRFFSQVDNALWGILNSGNFSDLDHLSFYLKVGNFMNDLASTAASRPNRYNDNFTEFNSFTKIYGMVQCNRDLSPEGCFPCLQNAISWIPDCCSNSRGARLYTSTCYLRYESYPFVEASPVSPPTSSPPQTANKPNATERGTETTKGKSTNVVLSIFLPILASLLSVAILGVLLSKRIRKNRTATNLYDTYEKELGTAESLQFNFTIVQNATDNFSNANNLGKGGFGIVYKGTLLDGQEIVVKRLSNNSDQGIEELKNEVLLIVKLQHRNLVKLLGFCWEGNEKLLIYEFAPNASLDRYIFDSTKRDSLDWERRLKIIEGIARGLLYLHEDSRHKIIHRDLKASNVLLDEQLEPKISNFGMARLFKVDQIQGNTARIVGTYGYMAPEYAMRGQFSVKSDVFSFGILVLEIITGRKNKVFFQPKHAEDLLSYAWRHWGEGKALDILDPALKDQYSVSEVIRSIHIASLCVQEDAALRPRMATVVRMLDSDSVTLVSPSTPTFFVNTNYTGGSGVHSAKAHSVNEVSLTELHPR